MPTNRHIAKAEADLYASTLLDALNEAGGMDAIMAARSQMETIIAYNRSHAELGEALGHQSMTGDARAELIKKVFAFCEPALLSVLAVMAERDDFDRLSIVYNIFNDQIAKKFNVNVVDVITRVALDDHLRDVIKRKAGADLGTDIVLNEAIDPNMLGGIIMSANGQRIDASVNTLLDNARTALKKNN